MPLFTLLIYLALIGLVTWLITTLIPMPGQIAKIIVVVAVVICVLIALQAFGIGLSPGPTVPNLGTHR